MRVGHDAFLRWLTRMLRQKAAILYAYLAYYFWVLGQQRVLGRRRSGNRMRILAEMSAARLPYHRQLQ
jgi:hypothetical protein